MHVGRRNKGRRAQSGITSSIPECSTQTLALTVPWLEGSHVVTLSRKRGCEMQLLVRQNTTLKRKRESLTKELGGNGHCVGISSLCHKHHYISTVLEGDKLVTSLKMWNIHTLWTKNVILRNPFYRWLSHTYAHKHMFITAQHYL